MAANDDWKIQVAWGSRILAMHGHGDLTMGHLSACGADGRIFIKRKDIALGEVTPADVLTLDLDAHKVAGEGAVHLESVLHTEVYKARQDVGAVVHTHPPYGTAMGATSAQLQFLTHDAVLFHDGLPRFENSPELIMNPEQGAAVAQALGSQRALLLKNHGVIVVGEDVAWAVVGALTLERAIRLQALASSLGSPRAMSADTAGELYPSKYRDEFIQTYWRYLIRECRRQGHDSGMPDGH